MDKNSDNFLKEAEFFIMIKEHIKNLLPDNPVIACSILSTVIDEYFIDHDISVIDGWNDIFAVTKQVHKELGDN